LLLLLLASLGPRPSCITCITTLPAPQQAYDNVRQANQTPCQALCEASQVQPCISDFVLMEVSTPSFCADCSLHAEASDA
jgi:hypothetical protein